MNDNDTTSTPETLHNSDTTSTPEDDSDTTSTPETLHAATPETLHDSDTTSTPETLHDSDESATPEHDSDEPATPDSDEPATPDSDEPATAVSLISELEVVRYAVQGAHIITEAIRNEDLVLFEDISSRAPAALAAIITLIDCRLYMICEVLGKQINASHLQGHHNIVRNWSFGPSDDDVLFPLEES